MLLSLLRKVELPDVEFIFNLGDWPLEDNFENPLPIFGWCGSTEQTDIPLPTWDQTKNSRHALFRELVLSIHLAWYIDCMQFNIIKNQKQENVKMCNILSRRQVT